VKLPKKLLVQMLRKMLQIRYFEEALVDLYARGLLPGIVHLSVGQEAAAVGVCENLRKDDFILSTHRGHGHFIAKGGELKPMMAEIFGRKAGYCKGKGGTQHIACLDFGSLGSLGIVGSGIPIAVGAGLSAKLRQTDQVAVSFFGDGASNRGTFHEGLNFASLYKLPVIFVCENNLYGEFTSQKRHQTIVDIANRAASYVMPGVTVDGNDVIAVYEAVKPAVERARQGDGPTLIECKTYRWRGHFEADPGQGERYRTKEEIASWMEKCPIKRYKLRLLQDNIITESEIEKVENAVRNQIEETIAYAKESPFPEPEETLDDVFAD